MSTDERDGKDTQTKQHLIINRSRRSFAKASGVVPVLLSLANRPAFGAICSPSGYASARPNGGVNPSGTRHVVGSCGGLSPGAWQTPYDGDGTWPSIFSPGGPNKKLIPNESEGLRNNTLYRTYSNGVEQFKEIGDTLLDNPIQYSGATLNSTATTMEEAFGYSGLFATESLYDVLQKGNDDPYQTGAHLVAALLNAVMQAGQGITGVMTVADVIDMYTQLSNTGTYTPGKNANSAASWPGAFFDLDGSGGAMTAYDWTAQECVDFIKQTFH